MNKHKHSFLRLAALAIICLLFGSLSLRAQEQMQSPVQMPNPPTPVVDQADVIDAATEERLNNILKNLSVNNQANVEMGVVTVKTTGGRDIFDFSFAIMRGWGIGAKEKGGLLLVVAVDDRRYYTQVSRHLEADMPDSLVGQIQRDRLVPQFREGNPAKGISDTVEAYIATLAEKRGFSVEGIDRQFAYRDEEPEDAGGGSRPTLGFSRSTLFIIIIIVVFLLLAGRGGGARGGCGGGGCLNFLLLNSLFNSGRGGWGSSGWGGGGFGGGSGWGGGGGGWGGFSGGGGDAGGGGAGGSW